VPVCCFLLLLLFSAGNQQQTPAQPLLPRGFRGAGEKILQQKNSEPPASHRSEPTAPSIQLPPQCGEFRVDGERRCSRVNFGEIASLRSQ
jgi:hypothetical protein